MNQNRQLFLFYTNTLNLSSCVCTGSIGFHCASGVGSYPSFFLFPKLDDDKDSHILFCWWPFSTDLIDELKITRFFFLSPSCTVSNSILVVQHPSIGF